MKTKISLGGQNSRGRTSGARSSRASSTIFKRLQKLDRKISHIDSEINYGIARILGTHKTLIERRGKLDLQRQNIRKLRKCQTK